MHAVQLDQLLPQIQQIQQSSSDLQKTGDSSFMDALVAAKEAVEKTEEPVKTETAKVDAISNQDTQKSPSVKPSESEKSAEIEEENLVLSSASIVQMEDNGKIVVSWQMTETVPEAELSETEQAYLGISSQQMDWLLKVQAKADGEAELPEENLAALIDMAEEFIPGSETDSEKLEMAQNLAVEEPLEFLEKIQNEVSQTAVLNSEEKTELTDKKETAIAEKKPQKSLNFKVTDLRTEKIEKNSAETVVSKVKSSKDFDISYKKDGDNSVQVTLDLAKGVEQNITSSSGQAAAANGSNFQSMLTNAIQENAPDFVKAGNIVLKDNNQGSINLILHPEKIGNVKINLNLSDKLVSGQITVHSQEAYDALKDSIAALKNAFAESGFETGEFNLNFSGEQQFAQNQNSAQENSQKTFMAEKTYSNYVSSAESDEAESAYENYSNISVNIVA